MNKILVSTIPSWSQQSGANTFSSLLEGIKDVDISSIYFRSDIPDSTVAKHYFHIVENRVIKSILNSNIKTGEEVQPSTSGMDNENENKLEHKRYAYFSRNRNCIFLWGRELLWKLGRWKSPELDKFLDKVRPDVFMFTIESYPYFNRVNEYIIKRCKPKKIIIYWWDDNFTYKQRKNPAYLISRFFIRRAAKRIMRVATDVLAISPKMKRECDDFFNVNSTIITKPIRNLDKHTYSLKNRPLRFLYTGSMVIGRQKTLIALARILQKINENGQRAYLDIYSKTVLNPKDSEALNIPGTCRIIGQIPQSQVFEEQLRSDVLVFVESFENKTARLSFSTKLTDYLSSGRCILAIGPEDISSMEYLSSEKAAITCFDENQLKIKVAEIIENPSIIQEYSDNGWDCGKRNHSPENNEALMKNILFR